MEVNRWRCSITHLILASGCVAKSPRWRYWHGDDVELGRLNMPDSHEGTQIEGATPNNVALAGLSGDFVDFPSEPSVGVYGEGRRDRGIGVAGTCDHHGVGVYGMGLDHGVGVVGRSMSGDQGETVPPIDFVGRDAGVVGQAKDGVGVFGHGGPWMLAVATPSTATGLPTTQPSDPDAVVRGGIFSAGWRGVQNVPQARDRSSLASRADRRSSCYQVTTRCCPRRRNWATCISLSSSVRQSRACGFCPDSC